MTLLSLGAVTGCGPNEAAPAIQLSPQAAFEAAVDVVPEDVRPGASVALQVFAVNEGDSLFTADVSLDIRTQGGSLVHERPWTSLNFPPGKAWLLSSGFLTHANSAAAPYSARIRIRDSQSGAVYFDDEVLSFGPGAVGGPEGQET